MTVNTEKTRWDNLDPKQDMQAILKEYIDDLERAETETQTAVTVHTARVPRRLRYVM